MITKIWRNLCAHGRSLKVNDDHDRWVLAAIKTVRILSWKPLYGRGHKAIDKCRLIFLFFWGGGVSLMQIYKEYLPCYQHSMIYGGAFVPIELSASTYGK